jgi:DNA repair protein RecO (recombination protein O)
MATYTDDGIVLRTHKLGEADRIITLLTREHGKIRAVAKGIRRTSSKVGARLEPFNQVRAQIIERSGLDIVGQVVSLRLFGATLMTDYPRYTAAEAMVETADRLITQEGEPALAHYRLLAGALRTVAGETSDGPRPADMVLDSYLLRAVAISGFAPSLDQCVVCGCRSGLDWFAATLGGVTCGPDRPTGAVMIDTDQRLYMPALMTGDWPSTRAVSDHTRARVASLIASFVTWHIDSALRSLKHVEHGG